MDERFKPIFKVDYSLVRDENGNQNLYCKTSDNVSIISEHYLGNIKDIVGYIEENQQLKEQVSYLRRSVERKESTISEMEQERIPYTNEYVKHLEQQLHQKEDIINKANEILSKEYKENVFEHYEYDLHKAVNTLKKLVEILDKKMDYKIDRQIKRIEDVSNS